MIRIWIFLLGFWGLTGCDSVVDLQPPAKNPNQVPEVVISKAKQLFPELKAFKAIPIDSSGIWGIGFQTDAPYSLTMDENGGFRGLLRHIPFKELPFNLKGGLLNTNTPDNYTSFQVLTEQKTLWGHIILYQPSDPTQVKSLLCLKEDFVQPGVWGWRRSMNIESYMFQKDLPLENIPFVTYFLDQNQLPAAIRVKLPVDFKYAPPAFTLVAYLRGKKIYYVYGVDKATIIDQYYDEQGNVLNLPNPFVNLPNGGISSGPTYIFNLPALSQAMTDALNQSLPGWALVKVVHDFQDNTCIIVRKSLVNYRIRLKPDWKEMVLETL